MANPTTNFGWVMPTSTSLVTNLPADFNTFGQAVDTSMSELLGGTTGQVLSKTSNTNMDFTWVTPTDQTPLTTKGDLFTFTTVDARLAVGNNGETLVADSSTSTGLRYQATNAAGKNALINGGFDIWQRGTSFTVASIAYTADRWQIWSTGAGGNCVVTRVAGTNGAQYAAEFGRQSGSTSLTIPQFAQTIETANATQYAGKNVVISFEALKGANYSGGNLTVGVITGTGTDQNFTAFTGAATVSNTFTLTTSNAGYTTGAVAIPAGTTEIALVFSYTATGTAGAADYVRLQKVQLEIGSVATTFTRAGGTIQGELAACQRYFQIFGGNDVFEYYGIGANLNTVNANCVIQWYVPMRTAPTATFTTASNYRVTQGTSANTCTGAVGDILTKNNAAIQFTVASGLTSGNAVRCLANNTLSGTISVSAEL